MKILIAHNLYSSAQPSGENTVVAAETAALTAAGVEVIPFLRSSDSFTPLEKATLPLRPLRAPQAPLAALLREHRPDVLHLHNPYPLLSPAVIRTAHAHGVPVVHTLHNFRQTCVAGLHLRDDQPCHDCGPTALPTAAVRHGCYRGSRAQSLVMATALPLHRATWRTLDRVLALTPTMATYATTLGIPPQRLVVRPNSVPDPGPHSVVGEGLLFAGRLRAEKGVALLLAAWSRHPVGSLGTLRIAGDGPLAPAVREAAATRTDITYLGRLDPAAMADALRAASAVVVPSTWDEPCPLIVLEALAQARPVLATDLGGLPWLVGEAGWSVPPTVEALTAALPTAVATAPSFWPVARAAYLARFTPQLAIETLLDTYRGVIEPRDHA